MDGFPDLRVELDQLKTVRGSFFQDGIECSFLCFRSKRTPVPRPTTG